ncbi:unnamed protein product [Cochlearia groenlandica]
MIVDPFEWDEEGISCNFQQHPLRKLDKINDPEEFDCRCKINGFDFEDSLCYTGANVNLISKSVTEKLSITNIRLSREEKSMNDSQEEHVDVSKVTKVFDGDPLITTRIPSSKKKRRVKRVEKSVKEDF